MLSQAEISDRLEIQQLLVDYSTAIDLRRFDDTLPVDAELLAGAVEGLPKVDGGSFRGLLSWPRQGSGHRASRTALNNPSNAGRV